MEHRFTCPNCSKGFKVFNDSGATDYSCDCPNCQSLLMIKDGEAWDFHKKLNEIDPRWPADGKDTGYVTLEE